MRILKSLPKLPVVTWAVGRGYIENFIKRWPETKRQVALVGGGRASANPPPAPSVVVSQPYFQFCHFWCARTKKFMHQTLNEQEPKFKNKWWIILEK